MYHTQSQVHPSPLRTSQTGCSSSTTLHVSAILQSFISDYLPLFLVRFFLERLLSVHSLFHLGCRIDKHRFTLLAQQGRLTHHWYVCVSSYWVCLAPRLVRPCGAQCGIVPVSYDNSATAVQSSQAVTDNSSLICKWWWWCRCYTTGENSCNHGLHSRKFADYLYSHSPW